jgi:hypothetical protein
VTVDGEQLIERDEVWVGDVGQRAELWSSPPRERLCAPGVARRISVA